MNKKFVCSKCKGVIDIKNNLIECNNHCKTCLLNEKIGTTPMKLLWKCKAKGDTWPTSYHNIKAGTKCPYCSATAPITYKNSFFHSEIDIPIDLNMLMKENTNEKELRQWSSRKSDNKFFFLAK